MTRSVEAKHRWYLDNRDKVLTRSQNRRRERRDLMDNFLRKQACAACGENDPSCFDFHHVDPSLKLEQVSRLIGEFRPLQRVVDEINKCVLVCANCHRKLHAGRLVLDLENHRLQVTLEEFMNSSSD